MADLILAGYLIAALLSILPIFRLLVASDVDLVDGDLDRYVLAVLALMCAPYWPVGLVAWVIVRCAPEDGK